MGGTHCCCVSSVSAILRQSFAIEACKPIMLLPNNVQYVHRCGSVHHHLCTVRTTTWFYMK